MPRLRLSLNPWRKAQILGLDIIQLLIFKLKKVACVSEMYSCQLRLGDDDEFCFYCASYFDKQTNIRNYYIVNFVNTCTPALVNLSGAFHISLSWNIIQNKRHL